MLIFQGVSLQIVSSPFGRKIHHPQLGLRTSITQMTRPFLKVGGPLPKTRPFSNQSSRGPIWIPGIPGVFVAKKNMLWVMTFVILDISKLQG